MLFEQHLFVAMMSSCDNVGDDSACVFVVHDDIDDEIRLSKSNEHCMRRWLQQLRLLAERLKIL
jgi:hypothetical protein